MNGILGPRFDDTLTGSDGAQAEQFYGDAGERSSSMAAAAPLDRVVREARRRVPSSTLATHTVADGFGTTDTITNV